MRIQEIIVENYRADLYHGTTLDKAEKIVASDKLIAQTPVHSPSLSKNNGKTVSLTRDITTAARLAGGYGDIKVIFVLDGSKLHQRYGKNIKPYDDTATDWYRNELARYGREDSLSKNKSTRIQGTGNEREEAVFGDIDNLDSYVKKIIVFFDKNAGGDERENLIKRMSQSPLLKHPKAEFGGLKAQYARTPRKMQANISKNNPLA